MYIHARRALDLSPGTFWSLTLREYSRECAAAAGRARDAYNRDLTHAWKSIAFLCQAFSSRGLPDLSRQFVHDPGESDRVPSMEYQRHVVETFAAQHGLKARPISQAGKAAMRKVRDEIRAYEAERAAEQAIELMKRRN